MVHLGLLSTLSLVLANVYATALPSDYNTTTASDLSVTEDSEFTGGERTDFTGADESDFAGSYRVDCSGNNAISVRCRTKEVPYARDFFHIGGRMLGNSLVDQIYVEKLTPRRTTKSRPLVFVHGGGVSGSTWLNTPDNRPGFAAYFTSLGYVVYLVDAASVGRSSENNLASFTMIPGTSPANVALGFTNVKASNTYPQSQLHTQWPGAGVPGDVIFDNFASSFLPLTNNFVAQETAMRESGSKLLSMLGTKAYVISHSLGARYPILWSNDCPQYLAGNINLEPATVPFWSYGWGLGGAPATPYGFVNTKLDYVPAISSASELVVESVGVETLAKRNCYLQKSPARQLPKVASVPYVIFTGEASVHITYNHCIIEYMKQVGGKPDWIKLADRGIKGNGHFGHVEKNNLAIARLVESWIRRH